MKKSIFITISIFLSALFFSCSDSHDEPEPVDVPTVRTVLVYMVANNSLGRYNFDGADLAEMQKAALDGQLGNCRWLVYHHPSGGTPVLKELSADGSFITLKEYSTDILSVSIDRMKQVIRDTRTLAPARDYGIVLWSHATGWLQNGVAEHDSRLRSFGEDGGKYMNITSLAEALKEQYMSFIYADCCYMANVEVAYQLRDCADYFVASAAELPAAGMDYSVNMGCLTSPTPDLIGAARNTYFHYFDDSVKNPNRSWCTMSVIDLKQMDALALATAELYKNGTFPHALNPQFFTASSNYYYCDFAQFAANILPGSDLSAEWESVFDKTVLYEVSTLYIIGGVAVNTHCGLTTFIQNSSKDNTLRNYSQLDWYEDVARFQPLP